MCILQVVCGVYVCVCLCCFKRVCCRLVLDKYISGRGILRRIYADSCHFILDVQRFSRTGGCDVDTTHINTK